MIEEIVVSPSQRDMFAVWDAEAERELMRRKSDFGKESEIRRINAERKRK